MQSLQLRNQISNNNGIPTQIQPKQIKKKHIYMYICNNRITTFIIDKKKKKRRYEQHVCNRSKYSNLMYNNKSMYIIEHKALNQCMYQ